MEQINLKEFFTSCGPTSTPKIKSERISRSRICMNRDIAIPLSDKDVLLQLLEGKEAWPVAFSKASQNYINALGLGLSEDFLLKPVEKDKSKRMSPMILRRSRSRNKDRSMSPSGAVKMKESKWDVRMEIALLLIDRILNCHEELPEGFLMHHLNWKSESKNLIEYLTKNSQSKTKLDKLTEANFFIIGESLRIILDKMGVLLPSVISQQILQLKFLKSRSGNVVINNRSKIEALQVLMLNITKSSRNLIQKLLEMCHILTTLSQVRMSSSQLALIISPSLFEMETRPDCLKLCIDLISLSDKLFQAPNELLVSLKTTINTRPVFINPFISKPEKTIMYRCVWPQTPSEKPALKMLPKPEILTPVSKSTTGKTINSFFPNSKRSLLPDSVVLVGFNKLSSPEYKRFDSVKSIIKPKSIFMETTKKIYEKSKSPFKRNKECLFPNFSEIKKPRLSRK